MAAATRPSDLVVSSPSLPQHELSLYTRDQSAIPPPIASPVMSGSASAVSDGHSSISGPTSISPSYISSVTPAPDFISQSSAAEVATEASRAQDYGFSFAEEQGSATLDGRAAAAERAVQLVNAFLDKILHDCLAIARSSDLESLRQAAADLLRKNLARDALAFADANLEDLLAVGDDEQDDTVHLRDFANAGNLEFVWKRVRLRVMMRSEKSDFDIDDDERHVQQQGLLSPGRRHSEIASIISLSGEIFLAGVLDFMAEQLFAHAAYFAVMRTRRNSKKSATAVPSSDHFIVEEQDIEKAALNSPMDRLWRGWRKSLRARGVGIGGATSSPRHGYSSSVTSSPSLTRRGSQPWGDGAYHNTVSELPTPRNIPGAFLETPAIERSQQDVVPHIADQDFPEHILASNIPIPTGTRDVDEIEVPGLAIDPDAVEEPWTEVEAPRRKSYADKAMLASQAPQSLNKRPAMTRQRSNSAPHPAVQSHPRSQSFEDDLQPACTNGTENDRGAEREAEESNDDATPIAIQQRTSYYGSANVTNADVTSREGISIAQNPNTIPAGAAIAGIAAGGTAAVAAAAAMSAAKHPLEPTTFSTDPEAVSKPKHNDQANIANANDQLSTAAAPSAPTFEISPTEKARNREAAVGLGFPSGISIPESVAPISIYNSLTSSPTNSKHFESPHVATSTAPRKATSGSEQIRAPSPDSDTEGSEPSKNPREFLASKNLATTRSSISQPKPRLVSVDSGSRVMSKVSMTGLDGTPATSSPVSPIGTSEASQKFAEATRSLKSNQQRSRSPSTSPRQQQEEFARPRAHSRISPKLAQKDFGSDAATAIPRRESSLRRLAFERQGSLVSLVDEGSHKVRGKNPLTSSSITSAEDFDSLIAGGETIKMTLSPSSVRETPTDAGSRKSSADYSILKSRLSGSKEDVSKGVLSKRPPLETVNSHHGQDSPRTSSKGSPNPEDPRGRSGSVATTKSRRSFSRPSLRNKSRTRAGLTAREPTVMTDSTRDFADFIRSTGPDREPRTLVPALTSRKSSVASKYDDRKGSIGGRSISKPDGQQETPPSVPAVSQNAGIKIKSSMLAREARAAADGGNSELIDFIRGGPNDGKKNKVDKTIAPFRLTMESDELRGLTDLVKQETNSAYTPSLGGAPSFVHREGRNSASTMATMNTYNSRAPLVQNGDNTSQSAYGNSLATPKAVQKKTSPQISESGDGKKRYRNKDPYAIDFSDEDEYDDDDDPLTALPQQGTTKAAEKPRPTGPAGGSLGDFLYDPNPAPAPAPAASTTTNTTKTSSLPSGLALNGVSYSPSSIQPASSSSQSRPDPNPTSSTTSTPSSGVPLAKPTGYIPRNPNRPRLESKPAGASGPRSARLNAIASSGTADLAAFLRDSGPPDGPSTSASSAGRGSGSNGRREVSGGAPAPTIGGSASRGYAYAGVGDKSRVKTSVAGGAGAGKAEAADKKSASSGGGGGKFWQRKRYVDLP